MNTIRQILAWLWDWRPVPAWRVDYAIHKVRTEMADGREV